MILTLSSHVLFIYIAYQLLTTVVDWPKLTKVHAENMGKLRLLVLFLSIALGSIVSHFFLELLNIGRSFSLYL